MVVALPPYPKPPVTADPSPGRRASAGHGLCRPRSYPGQVPTWPINRTEIRRRTFGSAPVRPAKAVREQIFVPRAAPAYRRAGEPDLAAGRVMKTVSPPSCSAWAPAGMSAATVLAELPRRGRYAGTHALRPCRWHDSPQARASARPPGSVRSRSPARHRRMGGLASAFSPCRQPAGQVRASQAGGGPQSTEQ